MWLKLSDDFGDAMDTFSDAAFRCHAEALLLVMRREQGPVLPRRLLLRHLNSPHVAQAVQELIGCGWWVELDDAFLIVQGMEHQPEPEVIAKRRAMAAERQRKLRAKQAGLGKPKEGSDPAPEPDAVARDVTRDATRDPGRDGAGRGGAGSTQLGVEQEEELRSNLDEGRCLACGQWECVCSGYRLPDLEPEALS